MQPDLASLALQRACLLSCLQQLRSSITVPYIPPVLRVFVAQHKKAHSPRLPHACGRASLLWALPGARSIPLLSTPNPHPLLPIQSSCEAAAMLLPSTYTS